MKEDRLENYCKRVQGMLRPGSVHHEYTVWHKAACDRHTSRKSQEVLTASVTLEPNQTNEKGHFKQRKGIHNDTDI